ncbi:hypothetical protein PM10SUCC1_00010 [Propionigenium maris DSM 9537]|uniref:Uncharacterized protein n=1 Tax=Propionigenium maris DSM 9537 TaxID=1123000 RepID=A0A9W6GIP5_9FUSO|nr:hypothetical protein [Propionigenium maris]GLI54486.1 hypothetical protein PM10SUCC1_00010 [Propionigenium maris DSM 9537]
MFGDLKYFILFLFILVCTKEAIKFGNYRGEESKRCYRCYDRVIPFRGEEISLGDSIDYGNYIDGREMENYLLNSNTESYLYVGDKKSLPFLERSLFSYLKTEKLEWISMGGRSYLRRGAEWIKLRDKNIPPLAVFQKGQINRLRELASTSKIGEPANQREKKRINRSLLEMEERIERLKENA